MKESKQSFSHEARTKQYLVDIIPQYINLAWGYIAEYINKISAPSDIKTAFLFKSRFADLNLSVRDLKDEISEKSDLGILLSPHEYIFRLHHLMSDLELQTQDLLAQSNSNNKLLKYIKPKTETVNNIILIQVILLEHKLRKNYIQDQIDSSIKELHFWVANNLPKIDPRESIPLYICRLIQVFESKRYNRDISLLYQSMMLASKTNKNFNLLILNNSLRNKNLLLELVLSKNNFTNDDFESFVVAIQTLTNSENEKIVIEFFNRNSEKFISFCLQNIKTLKNEVKKALYFYLGVLLQTQNKSQAIALILMLKKHFGNDQDYIFYIRCAEFYFTYPESIFDRNICHSYLIQAKTMIEESNDDASKNIRDTKEKKMKKNWLAQHHEYVIYLIKKLNKDGDGGLGAYIKPPVGVL